MSGRMLCASDRARGIQMENNMAEDDQAMELLNISDSI